MSRENQDWAAAAAKRSHRTVEAAAFVVEAVGRAEMDPEHAALDDLLEMRRQVDEPLR